MAQIIWNNVAAPNLGESNSLFAQAIQSLKDAGAGLKDTAKDYQTVVRNRSHAILQDYINSAKTPEELQSEAFNTGFKNLQATLANEYDAVKVNDYRDSAVDKLTKRAGDAVALEANKWNLQHNKDKAPTELALGLVNLSNARTDADFKAKNNPLVLRTNTVAADNAEKTQGFVIEGAALDVKSKRQTMELAQLASDLAKAKAPLERAEIQARINKLNAESNASSGNGGFTAAAGEAATVREIANVRKIGGDALAGVKDKFKFKDMKEVDDAILADETWSWAGLPKTAKLAKEMVNSTPEFSALPNPVKAAMYMGLVTKIREDNVLGKGDWFQLNRDKYFAGLLASAREHTGYIENAKAQEKVAIQDFAVTVNRMSGKAPDDAFGFKFANQQLGASVLDGYGVSPDILDKLNKGAIKQPAAPVTIKQNRAPEVQALNEKYLKTKDLGEKLKLMHQMTQLQQQYEAGTK